MRHYLGEEYDSFYTVTVKCNGVIRSSVWEDYIAETQAQGSVISEMHFPYRGKFGISQNKVLVKFRHGTAYFRDEKEDKLFRLRKLRIAKLEEMSDKHLALFLAMNQWVKTKQEGKSIAAYLEKKDYRNIAIYGMSYIGRTLADELKGTEINVAYGIDKKADSIYADMDMDVVTMDDYLGKVDAIIWRRAYLTDSVGPGRTWGRICRRCMVDSQ